jgi:hypothetical protein
MAEDVGSALTKGTVKLPGIGPVKKVYVYVGLGTAGVLAAYLMWRRQQAADTADATPADADLGTGLTTPDGGDVYGGATAGGSPTADPDITPMPTTNVEWTQQVIDYFNWLEPGFVSSTVGKYLARVPLSADEADFIRQAWAARGKPPEGPSNFTLTTDGNTTGSTTMPSVPAGLTVGTVTASTIALDWADSTDAKSYQVFRGAAQVGTPAGSSYTDTGLSSGTSYSYTVRAVNGSNVSAASGAVTGKTSGTGSSSTTTDPTLPAPKGLKAVRVDDGGVSLDWQPVPGAIGYKIYVAGHAQVGNSVVYSNVYIGLPRRKSSTVTVRAINKKNRVGTPASIKVNTLTHK